MPIKGELNDIALTSVVQMLCMEHRSATVALCRRGEEGLIFIEGGQIVHATLGYLQGEKAVYRLLAWKDGSFRITDPPEVSPQTIGLSWKHLLLEGSRQLDEEQLRLNGNGQQAQRILTDEEIAADENLEHALLVLLARCEQLVDRLRERKAQRRPTFALEWIGDLVTEMVTFCGGLPDDEECALGKVLGKAGREHGSLGLVNVKGNRISLVTAVNLYRNWSGDRSERTETFRQLARGLCAVIEEYCRIFEGFLNQQEAKERWREMYGVFVMEFVRSVESVPF